MSGAGKFDSCRDLLKKLQRLSLQSQYICSLLLFVVKNKNYSTSNKGIHDINTRNNLHLPFTNLSRVQRCVLFSGSMNFNHLPTNIKLLSGDVTHFKSVLRSYLTEHTIYNFDKFYKTTSQ
jgi:hypothetical protein